MNKFEETYNDLRATTITQKLDKQLIQTAKNVKIIANGIPKMIRDKDDTLKNLLIEIKKQIDNLDL